MRSAKNGEFAGSSENVGTGCRLTPCFTHHIMTLQSPSAHYNPPFETFHPVGYLHAQCDCGALPCVGAALFCWAPSMVECLEEPNRASSEPVRELDSKAVLQPRRSWKAVVRRPRDFATLQGENGRLTPTSSSHTKHSLSSTHRSSNLSNLLCHLPGHLHPIQIGPCHWKSPKQL